MWIHGYRLAIADAGSRNRFRYRLFATDPEHRFAAGANLLVLSLSFFHGILEFSGSLSSRLELQDERLFAELLAKDSHEKGSLAPSIGRFQIGSVDAESKRERCRVVGTAKGDVVGTNFARMFPRGVSTDRRIGWVADALCGMVEREAAPFGGIIQGPFETEATTTFDVELGTLEVLELGLVRSDGLESGLFALFEFREQGFGGQSLLAFDFHECVAG